MKLYEYQAKEVLKSFGVPVPDGVVAFTKEEAAKAAQTLGGGTFVVKAQVHAGGRGKAGGVKVVKGVDGVTSAAEKIIGMNLVSAQTGPEGKIVTRVLVEKAVDILREMYLGILVDREKSSVVVIASAEGGVEIEETAARHPEKILKEYADPAAGLLPFQCRKLGYELGVEHASVGKFAKALMALYRAFTERDLSLIEINPLVMTKGGDCVALDAKIIADDNGLLRQKTLASFHDPSEDDWREVEAAKHGLNYIALDGEIGCLVNGAGLAMATMDIIKQCGSAPANFLDVGGSATVEAITAGFKIILSDKKVRTILVNIFGGIMRCDVVAESIVAAAKEVSIGVPLVVRLKGTNAKLAREILARSDIKIQMAETMDEAAQRAVKSLGRNK